MSQRPRSGQGVLMKKLFLATTAFVAIAIPAGAADLRMPVKAPPPVVPLCANFGGGYIGGNIGWGYYNYKYHDKDFLVQTIDDDLPRNAYLSDDSWNGGVQIGYN